MKRIEVRCKGAANLPYSNLEPFQGNLKELSEENYKKLKKEILELGFSEPFSVWFSAEDKKYLLNGHQRHRVIKRMVEIEGYECPDLPVSFIEASSLKEAKKKVLALTSQYGQITGQGLYEFAMDSGLTPEEIKEHFRFPEINFDSWELEFFKDNTVEPGCDEDDVPEKVEPKTKRGDIYQLGRHRLMCGDSTSIDDVEKLMGGAKAIMVFTDPPYGVNFEQGKYIGREKQGKNRNFKPIANDDKQGDELRGFISQALSNASIVSDVCVAYVWSPPLLEGAEILKAFVDSGWHVQSQIIWNKSPFVIGRADYHWKHEICWYGYKGQNHQWFGGRDKSTVWDVSKTRSSDSHPTMKPVELAEIACNNSTKTNDNVLDLFGGSGSTVIACEKTGRSCFMMEIDPHYCDVIVSRWEKYTGGKALILAQNSHDATS